MVVDLRPPGRWLARAVAAIVILIGIAAVALAGCATVKAVETACEPSTVDEVRIVSELAREDFVAALAPEVECLVKAVVAQVFAPPSGQVLTSASVDMAVVRAHAAAWSRAHP